MSVREILFRGRRVDNGEWVQGAFIPDALETTLGTFGLDGYIKPVGRTKEERMMVEVDRETVGQYTGLTDRNGKRIFEGDIVCIPVECMPDFLLHHYEVRWRKTNPGPGFALYRDDTFYDWAMGEIEVIGNRHDDPELLERGRE